MSDSVAAQGGCCRCCCSFILTLGFTALFMWLSLRTSDPKCFVLDFYVPALNTTDHNSTTAATFTNTAIALRLRFENVMKDEGVLYDKVNLTIFYANDSLSVANHTMDGMKQGHHKKATKKELVQTHGMHWEKAYEDALRNSSVFRVDLATRVRFKIMFWKTKRHDLVVGANVNVDYSGHKSNKGKIRMKSSCAPIPRSHLAWLGLWILFFLMTLLW